MILSTLRAAGVLRILLLVLAGAAWCMSFAPAALPWLQLLSLAAALHVLQQQLQGQGCARAGFRSGFVLGWVYGFAMFAVGICWLYISLHEFGEVPAVIAVIAVLALAAYMALFPALALAVTGAAGVLTHQRVWAHTIAAAAWAGIEWLRAVVFTGFPWLSTGEAWIDSPLAGFYPLVGSYGVAALVALASCLLADAARRPVAAVLAASVFSAAALAGGAWLQQQSWGVQAVAKVKVHLVQPDVSQTIKFDPEHITRNFLDTVLLGRRAAEESDPGDWLMFPETALPVLWQEAPATWRNAFAGLAYEYQVPVVMGVALQDGEEIYTNSVIALLPENMNAPEQPALRYDKRHLVPFGEFIPLGFRWFVDLMNMPLGDFTRGRGSPVPFTLGPLRVLPNVCYEDVFGQEMAHLVRSSLEEPHVLFNVSNLAWFGGSWALEQHAQMSRVRAAELRKPMVRATNTGISGVIDAKGHWVMRMPDNERAVASADLTGTQGFTPYARYGLLMPVAFILAVSVIFALLAFLCAFAAERRRDVQ